MFDKRLLKEIPEAKSYVMKQVLCQWLALGMNIVFTIGLTYLLVLLFDNTLAISQLIMFVIGAIVVFIIRSMALRKATSYSFSGASFVKTTLRKRLFQKILNIGNHYQDYVSTSELVQLSVEGINQLETYFALYLPQLFYSVLAPITLFVIISFLDFQSALVLFICVPLIPVSIVLVQKFAKKLLAKYWSSYTTLGDSFLENLQGLTTLKIYQSDQYKQIQMNKEAENFRKITMRVLIMQLNSISVMDIVAYGGAGLGSYFALSNYQSGEISLFSAIFILLVSFEFFIPLRQLGSFFHIAMNGIAASEKIFKVLDIEENKTSNKIMSGVEFPIHIEDLSFQYDKDRSILDHISLNIKPHQFVGIIGESGAGKSTIAQLIMGYHTNYMGRLSIQGIDRKEIKDEDFLNHFVYITHDPVVFKGTLRENLNMGTTYHDDTLWKALKKVCLDEYFQSQDGLDIILLESGSNLSGGQKQRLNLARALLSDSDVYVFDEATSNIDSESEENILSVIQSLKKEKSVIMITHRLSNVVDCDQIVVMEQGQVIEMDNHQSLMKQKGHYYHMFTRQEELEVYQ